MALPRLRRLIRKLARVALPPEQCRTLGQLTVILTDDAAMPAYKERCFGIRLQTDVITQSYAAIPGVSPPLAELIINAEQALREGTRRPTGAAFELALYLAHGLDHLAGHDDATPSARNAMRRREVEWLHGLEDEWAELVSS